MRCSFLLVGTVMIAGSCAQEPARPSPPARNETPAPVEVTDEAPQPGSSSTASERIARDPAGSDSGTPGAPADSASDVPAFYTVSTYDEHSDPRVDLAATIQRATAENKRILVQVGGDWCGWCHRISAYMANNRKVRKLLHEHFLVMKVTYPGDHADAFLSGYPPIPGYPHLYVLEPDGTLIHSQGTAELEEGPGYNEDVFCRFLTKWSLAAAE